MNSAVLGKNKDLLELQSMGWNHDDIDTYVNHESPCDMLGPARAMRGKFIKSFKRVVRVAKNNYICSDYYSSINQSIYT